jgi:methylamine dehydrogenase heavy chain
MKRAAIALAALVVVAVRAEVAIEPVGQSVSLTELKHTWFWSNDPLLQKVSLTDFETGRSVGMVGGGWMITSPVFPHHRAEFYVPETHYSRGSRGERTDVLTFYDPHTLAPTTEVMLPGKRAHNTLPAGNAAISDDDRFIAIFNMVPAQSLSIVDVQNRKFVTEIDTPGCAMVYAAGARRFMMMCGNGALMFVTLKDDGTLSEIKRNERQFDPMKDPVREYGVRVGDVWHFVSFEGNLYSVDVSQPSPVFAQPWSLLSDAERADRWRLSGREYIAIHASSHRLYALMHQGEPDTHKQGGTHLFIYDLGTHHRIDTVKLLCPGITFSGEPIEFPERWTWLYNWITTLAMRDPRARPDLIAVTQDDKPTLLVSGEFTGMVAVFDAMTLQLRRRVATGNITTMTLTPATWSEVGP